jgi:hypothetical protein
MFDQKSTKRRYLHEIVRTDVDFLVDAEIIDYSMLVGEIIDVEYQALRE